MNHLTFTLWNIMLLLVLPDAKFSFISENINCAILKNVFAFCTLFLPHFFLSSPSSRGFLRMSCFHPAPREQVQRRGTGVEGSFQVWAGLGSRESRFGATLKGCPFLPCPRPMFRGGPITFSSPVPGQCGVCGTE